MLNLIPYDTLRPFRRQNDIVKQIYVGIFDSEVKILSNIALSVILILWQAAGSVQREISGVLVTEQL